MTEATTLPEYIQNLHDYFSQNANKIDSWLLEYAAQDPDLGLEKSPDGGVIHFELTPELSGKLAPLYLASAIEWANTDPQKLQLHEDRDIVGLLGSLACALPYADQQTQNAAIEFIQNYHRHGNFGGSDQNIGEGFFILAASAYALPDIAPETRDSLFATIVQPVTDRALLALASSLPPESLGEFEDFGNGFIFLMANPQPRDVAWVTDTFTALYEKSPEPLDDDPIYSAYFLNEAHPAIIRSLAPAVREDLILDGVGFSADVTTTVFSRLKELAATNQDDGQHVLFADKVMEWVGIEPPMCLAGITDEAALGVDGTTLARFYAAMPDNKQPPFAAAIRAKIAAFGKEKAATLPRITAWLSWLDARHPLADGNGSASPLANDSPGGGSGGATPKLLLHHGFCRGM